MNFCSIYNYYSRIDDFPQIQVPLSSASPTAFDTALPSAESDMLPLSHLTPKTLLGAGGEQREMMGHLYAAQIASTIATKNPEETRTVLVGFGLERVNMERETFFDLLELIQKVIWD
jgi:proteasome assembly chaperone 3